MLKLKYELTCNGCGKTEVLVDMDASFDLDWQPLMPIRPDGWKEIGSAHFCPGHELAVKVYDDEPGGKVYYDSPNGGHSIVR